MKKLHHFATMARLRKIMKHEDFNKIRITSSKTPNSYWIETVNGETLTLVTNGRGYISYMVYTSSNRTEQGFIMNPDNIVLRKFAFALHFILNERYELNMFEKIHFARNESICTRFPSWLCCLLGDS